MPKPRLGAATWRACLLCVLSISVRFNPVFPSNLDNCTCDTRERHMENVILFPGLFLAMYFGLDTVLPASHQTLCPSNPVGGVRRASLDDSRLPCGRSVQRLVADRRAMGGWPTVVLFLHLCLFNRWLLQATFEVIGGKSAPLIRG
jgi:hypothetical protein